MMLENKAFSSAYVPGSRAAGKLLYDLSNQSMISTEGTISVTVAFEKVPASGDPNIVVFQYGQNQDAVGVGGNAVTVIYYPFTQKFVASLAAASIASDAIPIQARQPDGTIVPYMITVHWKNTSPYVEMWIDGSGKMAPKNPPIPAKPINVQSHTLSLGTDFLPASRMDNGGLIFDNVLVLAFKPTDEEIQAWYLSNAPFMDATERRVVGKAAIMEIVDRGQIVGGGQIVGRVSIQEMVFLKSDMTALAAGVFSGFKSSEKVYAHNFGYRPLVAGVCRQREDAT